MILSGLQPSRVGGDIGLIAFLNAATGWKRTKNKNQQEIKSGFSRSSWVWLHLLKSWNKGCKIHPAEGTGIHVCSFAQEAMPSTTARPHIMLALFPATSLCDDVRVMRCCVGPKGKICQMECWGGGRGKQCPHVSHSLGSRISGAGHRAHSWASSWVELPPLKHLRQGVSLSHYTEASVFCVLFHVVITLEFSIVHPLNQEATSATAGNFA